VRRSESPQTVAVDPQKGGRGGNIVSPALLAVGERLERLADDHLQVAALPG